MLYSRNDDLKILKQKFCSEDSIGITYDDEHNIALLPDGTEMGNCTNCARYVIKELGRGDVYGFSTDDNPVESEQVEAAGGHDFALIDGRFIVDIWISLYTGAEDQIVFDLLDDNDAKKTSEIFGNTELWKVLNLDKNCFETPQITVPRHEPKPEKKKTPVKPF